LALACVPRSGIARFGLEDWEREVGLLWGAAAGVFWACCPGARRANLYAEDGVSGRLSFTKDF
jgi:hypothetical protein